MNDQQIHANVNVLGPARLAAQLLDFGESCIVALEAYFLAVMGWDYWADFPTVSTYDISGINETPTPGSIGAGIAALCWSILSNSQTFATLVNAGRADDLAGTVAALCAWRSDLTDEINANVAILAPTFAPEAKMFAPEAKKAAIPEPVVVPASSISAVDDTTAPVVDAPTPAPSPVKSEPVATPDAPEIAAPVAADSPPVGDDRPHSIAQYGDTFWSLGLRVGISAETVKRCNPGMTSVTPGSVVYLA